MCIETYLSLLSISFKMLNSLLLFVNVASANGVSVCHVDRQWLGDPARRPVSMNFSDKNTPLIGQFPHKIGILSSSKQLSDKKFCVRFPSNCSLKTATLHHNAAMKITQTTHAPHPPSDSQISRPSGVPVILSPSLSSDSCSPKVLHF